MPALLPAGTHRLPPLGGRLFVAYRLIWWLLLAAAVVASAVALLDGGSHLPVLVVRLAKSVVLVSVAAVLFVRRRRDPVAAMFALSFLLWTVSSSVDFIGPAASWPLLLDRVRFLVFALALLFFPDGRWRLGQIGPLATAIMLSFLIGLAEGLGLLSTGLYLPLAIGSVLAALASLLIRYRSQEATAQQQLKWIALGLVVGIGLILTARAGAAIFPAESSSMALIVLPELMFQLGIVVIALGFLTSLLRYRLYDAEAAISRSAAYAGLTITIVGIFAACEALIELLGQQYFGSNLGAVSGTVAAAIAATLLSPLHSRISGWAEARFQHDLAVLKRDLPDLLLALSAGSSTRRFAQLVLPRIEQAVQSTRMALIIEGRLAATQGIGVAPARRLLKDWKPPCAFAAFDRDDQDAFPLRVPLRCPFGAVRGWLLLGPRPDGSFYGKDDLDALVEVARPLQKSLFAVAEHEVQEKRGQRQIRRIKAALRSIEIELEELRRRAA